MNIFVLNTGRCGSMTFIKACSHITNFSCGHESRTHLLGSDRFRYPDRHIEADNRLCWLLGRLDQAYGNRAFYVHLHRDRSETAASFVRRYDSGILRAYRGKGILLGMPENSDPMTVALDYCDTVTRNIESFLKDKDLTMDIRLESVQHDFSVFWKRIGAEGDLSTALAEFQVRYNAGKTPDVQLPGNMIQDEDGRLDLGGHS